jgi:hypothetical protein
MNIKTLTAEDLSQKFLNDPDINHDIAPAPLSVRLGRSHFKCNKVADPVSD